MRFVEKRNWFDGGEDGIKESNGEKRFSQVSNNFDMGLYEIIFVNILFIYIVNYDVIIVIKGFINIV